MIRENGGAGMCTGHKGGGGGEVLDWVTHIMPSNLATMFASGIKQSF